MLSYITCKELRGLTMLLLLSCWIIAGITAEDSPTRHYRLKNSSFCLRFGNSLQRDDIMWTFNEDLIVYNKKVTNKTDKMEYNPSDMSLCINNVNETYSGIYKIDFVNSQFKKSTETHILMVEDSVPRPVIRMSAMHSNLSAGFCNITVNCSIQDDWMLSVCDEDSCRTHQKSFGNINITITPQNKSIVCSGNNHVSTNNVSESTQAECFDKSISEPEETPQPFIWILIFIVCIACPSILCLAIVLFSTRCKCHQAQASPPLLMDIQAVEAQPQPLPRASSSSSSGAEASYENVDAGQTSSPCISPTEQSQNVDTVYSYLQAPNVTTSGANSDSTEVRVASATQPVILDEAGQPAQIDTVYSVLQKPKKLKSQHNQ